MSLETPLFFSPCVRSDSEAHFRRGAITHMERCFPVGRCASDTAVLHSHSQQAEGKVRENLESCVSYSYGGHIDKQAQKRRQIHP